MCVLPSSVSEISLSANVQIVLLFQHFAKHLKEIVTQVGIVIHFLQSEACGMNINKGIQAS